ncbi:aminopeptidase N-like [Ptychodera flava]|uniref:aminopeptidase N-like n=1 Tax=Ptychodera flava TaxID=63121 RepID=UPI003969D5DA
MNVGGPANCAPSLVSYAECIGNDRRLSALGTMANSPTQTQTHLANNLNYADKTPKEIEVHIAGYSTHSTGLYLSKYKAAFLAIAILLLCLALVLLVIFVIKRPECDDVATVTETPVTAAAVKSGPLWQSWRLPTSITPKFYKLELQLFIEKRVLRGYVEITFECVETTKFILLQSDNIEVTQYKLESRRKRNPDTPEIVGKPTYSVAFYYVIFKLNSKLVEGEEYILRLHFSGSIGDSNGYGIYQTNYIDDKGKLRLIAASFLSPVAARRVFPCFDEPSYKTNFSISIVHRREFIALSNMPELPEPEGREERSDGWITTHFQTTPKMSTYLLAFIVCDFNSTETYKSNHGRVDFRVWAREGALDQVQYAMNIGPKIFTYLESYASIPYSLPKMDMIALPTLLAFGMENWGLNTFKEKALLYKEGTSSSRDQQWIALIIGHELSHQWHSNLVTQAWWDELWLKESFATFMGLKAVDHVHPDFYMTDQQFLTDDLHNVFILDSLSTSHPVYQKVSTPIEIFDNFDMIAYQKGPALVKMMYYFLGESTFKKGLFKYLIDNAYGSATSEDLWKAMEWAAKEDGLDIDVPNVMDTWLLQMGYPLVTITRDYEKGTATVTQKHFLMDSGTNGTIRESPYGYKWQVPITYTSAGEPNFQNPQTAWLKTHEDDLNITNVASDEWIVGNTNQAFYYRVNYDLKNWELIIDQLNTQHTAISVCQKAAMIDDAFNIARAGELDPLIGLKLTRYLKDETDYLPWKAALRNLGHLDRLLSRTSAYGAFQKYMLKQAENLYDYVGWNDTGLQLERYHRELILRVSCGYSHRDCMVQAKKMFDDWMFQGKAIAPNLKKVVICGGIAAGGIEEWNFAWQKYKESNVASEKEVFIETLTCSRQLWILSRYLDKTLENGDIDALQSLEVYKAMSQSSIGSYVMWDFFRENWNVMSARYGAGLYQMDPLVEAITSSFVTEFKLQELQYFIDQHVIGSDINNGNGVAGSQSFLAALDKTKANVKWLKENVGPVQRWLEEQIS